MRSASRIAEQIVDVLNRGIIRNAVNMPSIDAASLKVFGPYLDLGQARHARAADRPAPDRTLRIAYWGKIVDLDANAVTRAIQRGFLRRISGEDVNDVNAPYFLQRLGVQVEVIKSNRDSDYTELIQVEAVAADGVTSAPPAR
jgi:D-3-phosphoglycerate dehydrogenase / 2-oxoglutarate reductase